MPRIWGYTRGCLNVRAVASYASQSSYRSAYGCNAFRAAIEQGLKLRALRIPAVNMMISPV